MRFRELERIPFSWVPHLGDFYINRFMGPGTLETNTKELVRCIKHYRVVDGDKLSWRKRQGDEAIVWGFMREDKGNQFYPADSDTLVYAPKMKRVK